MKKPWDMVLLVSSMAMLVAITWVQFVRAANEEGQPAETFSTYIPYISAPSDVDVWYGLNQSFGPGRPQQWANIPGNIRNSENVAALHYSLNGGPLNELAIGPDRRRLQNTGDFNIELDFDDLQNGTNLVDIVTTYQNMRQVTETVTLSYDPETLPLNNEMVIDWSSASSINDVAQVVDGKWELNQDTSTVRAVEPGYDRLVAIGDVSWEFYEVEVPITIHSQFTTGNAALVGLVMRWEGHSNNDFYKKGGAVVPLEQPQEGWWPLGALINYETRENETPGYLSMISNDFYRLIIYPDADRQAAEEIVLDLDVPYIFKAQVAPNPNVTGEDIYRLKVWPQGSPEPAEWTVSGYENPGNDEFDPGGLAAGSFLLLAHHSDVSFGNVIVRPLP